MFYQLKHIFTLRVLSYSTCLSIFGSLSALGVARAFLYWAFSSVCGWLSKMDLTFQPSTFPLARFLNFTFFGKHGHYSMPFSKYFVESKFTPPSILKVSYKNHFMHRWCFEILQKIKSKLILVISSHIFHINQISINLAVV